MIERSSISMVYMSASSTSLRKLRISRWWAPQRLSLASFERWDSQLSNGTNLVFEHVRHDELRQISNPSILQRVRFRQKQWQSRSPDCLFFAETSPSVILTILKCVLTHRGERIRRRNWCRLKAENLTFQTTPSSVSGAHHLEIRSFQSEVDEELT